MYKPPNKRQILCAAPTQPTAALLQQQTNDLIRAPLGFLDIPPEIRVQIYHLALIEPEAYNTGDLGEREEHEQGCDAIAYYGAPPLLRTCRLIRAEGLPIFYSKNSFVLRIADDVDAMRRNWRAIPTTDQRSRIDTQIACPQFMKTFDENGFLQMMTSLTVMWSSAYYALGTWDTEDYWTDPNSHYCNLGFVGLGRDVAKRDPRRRVGGDKLNWNNYGDVWGAYKKALPTRRPESDATAPDVVWNMKTPYNKAAAVDFVAAMQRFKKLCPEAMAWVEVKVVWFKLKRIDLVDNYGRAGAWPPAKALPRRF